MAIPFDMFRDARAVEMPPGREVWPNPSGQIRVQIGPGLAETGLNACCVCGTVILADFADEHHRECLARRGRYPRD